MKKAALFLIFFLVALIILPGGTASWKDTLYMEGVLRSVSNPVEDEEGDLSDWFDIEDPSERADEPGSNDLPKKEEGQSEEPAGNNNDQETVVESESGTRQNEDKKPVFKITIAADPDDGGSVNSAGSHKEGKTVKVIAKPAKDYIFEGWFEDGELVSKEITYTFTVGRDRSLRALFTIVEAPDPDSPADEPDKPGKPDDKEDVSNNKTDENNSGFENNTNVCPAE